MEEFLILPGTSVPSGSINETKIEIAQESKNSCLEREYYIVFTHKIELILL